MLTSMVINLKALETQPYDLKSGRYVHAFFLDTIKKGNKELAEGIHSGSGIKPFTVSPIQGSFGRISTGRVFIKDFEYWIRFTFLTEEVFKAFSSVVFPLSVDNSIINLGVGKFKVTKVKLERKNLKEWLHITSFKEIKEEAEEKARKIINNANPPYHLRFSFHTPTSFRRGKISYLFPEPTLIFKSYLKKWNSFSEIRIRDDLIEKITPFLIVTSYRLRTETYDTGDAVLAGFKGVCTLSYLEKNLYILSDLISLSKFSFFCGTGHKTTMGMGMTRFDYEKI